MTGSFQFCLICSVLFCSSKSFNSVYICTLFMMLLVSVVIQFISRWSLNRRSNSMWGEEAKFICENVLYGINVSIATILNILHFDMDSCHQDVENGVQCITSFLPNFSRKYYGHLHTFTVLVFALSVRFICTLHEIKFEMIFYQLPNLMHSGDNFATVQPFR